MANNYLLLRTSDNYLYINILLARLQEEGYDCHLRDENTVSIDPLLNAAVGGIKLMVKEEDYERAAASLDTLDAEYVATLSCPACGKTTLQRLKKTFEAKGFFSKLWFQLTMGSTQTEEKFCRCTYCGYKTTELP